MQWERHSSDTQRLAQEAIERFVDYDEWFLREVEVGLAAADRGEFIEHEDITKLINGTFGITRRNRPAGKLPVAPR